MTFRSRQFYILSIVSLVLLTCYFIYGEDLFEKYFSYDESILKSSECAREGETVSYITKEKSNGNGAAEIIVENSLEREESRFEVRLMSANHYHPVEIHRCGIYVLFETNRDNDTLKALPGFKNSLWKYDYSGKGREIVVLAEMDAKTNQPVLYFSPDFRIDPGERYTALIRDYLGSPNYALVIKDLSSLENIFEIPIQEIVKRNKDIVGDIGLKGWTKDGRYFWADTAYGANELGFIRVDSRDWTFELFESPKDVLGGDALNLENGYITIHPGNVWFGISEIDQEEREDRRSRGMGTELYIENLITRERRFVASTTEPLYYFRPFWVSPTELQYELFSGEKKIFRLTD